MEKREYKIADIGPLISIKMIDDLWKPLSDLVCNIYPSNAEVQNVQTDSNGYLNEKNAKLGSKIEITMSNEVIEKDFQFPSNPGPLPVFDLQNRNEGGNGPLQRKDSRSELVQHLQRTLYALGYELGTSGIDGKFGKITEQAVMEYQSTHKDWEGKELVVDGMVGPKTADALNRSMVGLWYSTYEAPKKLTEGYSIKIVSANIANEGFEI